MANILNYLVNPINSLYFKIRVGGFALKCFQLFVERKWQNKT